MKLDLVSVIITTYGRDITMLSQAIESVKNQTYKNIELIIIDDNGIGTDIQKKNEKFLLSDKSIRYISNIKNSGAQFSRNIGILQATGEYIAFLDDDDIWMPDKIKKQVHLLKTNNLDMVFCNGFRFYDNNLNKRKLYQNYFITNEFITYNMQLQSDKIGSTSHPLIRKDCFARTGLFDLEMPARQDYEMWLRICKYYKVMGINETLFYYRYHEGDRITKSYKKELLSYQLLWKKYKSDYKKDDIARANILFSLAITYFKMKKICKAIFFASRALISNPNTIIKLINNHKNHKAQF